MKKRLLSIALAVAMLFALSSHALAQEESTATLELTQPADWNEGKFKFNVPNFDFGQHEATLKAFEANATGELSISALNTAETITVSISGFTIGDTPTMAGFTINLVGELNDSLTGTTTGYEGIISEKQKINIAVDASGAVYEATVDFVATLDVPANTAGLAGSAQAEMTWTQVVGEP